MFSVLISEFEYNLLFRIILLFVIGATIGSFLNVVIYRLPIILMRKWRAESYETLGLDYVKNDEFPSKFNLLVPQSGCLSCHQAIPFWANIPIIGFLLVRGKCVKCAIKIPVAYLFIEIVTAILFAYSGYITSDILLLFAELVFISFILCLIMIDYNTFYLPDELTLLLLWLGLLFNLHGLISGSLVSALVGAAFGYAILWLVYWLFRLITRREGLGYGDFKFLAALLAWVGISGLIPILFIAPLLGIVYFVIAYLKGKVTLHKAVPFGPFLGIAAIIILFFGKTFLIPLPI